MRALGTIIERPAEGLSSHEIHSGILDYFDDWQSIDPRLLPHHARLSPFSDAFGHDIVNLATYAHEILEWLRPEKIRASPSVVIVGGMTDAFVTTLRSAADLVGGALAYVATEKPGQAPQDSLRALISWAKKNETRAAPAVRSLLTSSDLEWFWRLRTIRDFIVHEGAEANIHCDGRQFNLWLYSPSRGWITREPLLPLLDRKLAALLNFANAAASVVNAAIALPKDRVGSRVVSGVLVPALHMLHDQAPDYSAPSP